MDNLVALLAIAFGVWALAESCEDKSNDGGNGGGAKKKGSEGE